MITEEMTRELPEKDRFRGEAGEVVWHESEEAMLRDLANEGRKWYLKPNGRRIDLTKYRKE